MVTCSTTVESGLLPHPIEYAQVDPDQHPMSARELRDNGWHELRYGWLHVQSGRGGASTLWVPVAQWAHILVEFWSGSGWKYWITTGTADDAPRGSIPLPDWGCYEYTQPNGEEGVFPAEMANTALDNAAVELVERIRDEQGVRQALRDIRLVQMAYARNGADDAAGREALRAWLERICDGTIYSAGGLWTSVEENSA